MLRVVNTYPAAAKQFGMYAECTIVLVLGVADTFGVVGTECLRRKFASVTGLAC